MGLNPWTKFHVNFSKILFPPRIFLLFAHFWRDFSSTFFFFIIFFQWCHDWFLSLSGKLANKGKKNIKKIMHNLQFPNKKQQLLLPATGNSYSTLLSTSSPPQLDKSPSTSFTAAFYWWGLSFYGMWYNRKQLSHWCTQMLPFCNASAAIIFFQICWEAALKLLLPEGSSAEPLVLKVLHRRFCLRSASIKSHN